MSTRCQIEFKHITRQENRKKPLISSRTVYRHSDGYPEGVIPDLKKFLRWNGGRNFDLEYQAANFIYWSKRMYEEIYFNGKWDDLQNTNLQIGFGICENNELHGDIEYYYEVISETNEPITILVYEVDYSKKVCKENLKLISEVIINYEQRNKEQD